MSVDFFQAGGISMLGEGGALLAGVLIIAIALTRYQRRNPEKRCRSLEKKVNALYQREGLPPLNEAEALLNPIYSLIHQAIANHDEKQACQGILLLKNCVTAGWLRANEAKKLKGLIFEGFNDHQADSISQMIDILCLLSTRQTAIDTREIVQQFTDIGLLALKEKENFLAAKAVNGIFAFLMFRKQHISEELLQLCLQGIKAIGAAALHRHDMGLFREIVAQLTDWMDKSIFPEFSQSLLDVLTVWLHDIVKNEDAQGLEVMADLFPRIIRRKELPKEEIVLFLQEWLRLAGIAALNPASVLAPAMMFTVLQTVLKQEDLLLWTLAVGAAGQVPAQAIQQRGITKAFTVLYPILETGRILLASELKFGGDGYADSYRQQALLVVVNESLILMNLGARVDLISTADEMIAKVRRSWLEFPEACYTRKQAQKFCQLLYFYWCRTQCKSGCREKEVEAELTIPLRLTERERQKLKFLA